MEVPLLPVNGTTIQLEGYAFRLGNVDRLEVIPKANLSLDRLMIEVGGRRLVERTTLLGNVDVDDLLRFDVENGAEIEWVSVLQVIDAGSVVHQGLLKSGAVGVAFIVAFESVSLAFVLNYGICMHTNGPRIAVNLVHVFGRNAKNTTLLDDLGILPHDLLHDHQIFHGDTRVNALRLVPSDDGLLSDIDQNIVGLVTFATGDDIGNTRDMSIPGLDVLLQKLLLRLKESDGVENEIALLLQNDIDRNGDFAF